jgi:hypothetical protein
MERDVQIQGKLPGKFPGKLSQKMKGVKRALRRQTATFGMEEARTTLMTTSPPGPGKPQRLAARCRPEQARE